jgi:hypothetical protein
MSWTAAKSGPILLLPVAAPLSAGAWQGAKVVCEDGGELVFGEACPCRHPAHGIEGYRIDEVLTGGPGTKEWSSASSHGKNSKVKHCESRRQSILSAYPDAVLSNPFGEYKERGGQYSYRCRWRVQRDPIYKLDTSNACLNPRQ